MGKKAKMNLEDPDGFGLKKVVLKINSTKAEVIAVVQDMSLQSANCVGTKLGFVIIVIGFHLFHQD